MRPIIDFKARGHESVLFHKTVSSLFSGVNGDKGCLGSLYQFPEMSMSYNVLDSTMLPDVIYYYSDDSEGPPGARPTANISCRSCVGGPFPTDFSQ